MTELGIAITLTTALLLAVEFLRHRRSPLPVRGWIGMALLAVAEILMFLHVWPVNVYFTPIAWTAYLLLADSMVEAITGRSRMKDSSRRFLLCAFLSIPLWLIFEAYNLRLANWTYVGVPQNWAGAILGYGWSFATITPGILETADLIEAFGWFDRVSQGTTSLFADKTAVRGALKGRGFSRAEQVLDLCHSERASAREEPAVSNVSTASSVVPPQRTSTPWGFEVPQGRNGSPVSKRPLRFSQATERAMVVFGAACLLIPLVIPLRIAAYLFVLIWVGFVFLLDPVNHRLGLPSLLGDLAEGRRGRFYSLLLSGWVCGWLWEFWNSWAAAKWHYIFPMFQEWKIFEMPAPGFLGFLPFALECFVMYVSAAAALGVRERAAANLRAKS